MYWFGNININLFWVIQKPLSGQAKLNFAGLSEVQFCQAERSRSPFRLKAFDFAQDGIYFL